MVVFHYLNKATNLLQMMKNRVLLFIVISLTVIVISGCEDKVVDHYKMNVPVYLSYEELRSSVDYVNPQIIEQTGKIYFKDSLIFLNEPFKGIHIINNTDPSNPQKTGYIKIPGNIDMAIKNNTLYADSYIDLVAFDISNPDHIREVNRTTNVFSYTLPGYDKDYQVKEIERMKGVVTGWEIKKVSKEVKAHTHLPWRVNEKYSGHFSLGTNSGYGGNFAGNSYGIGGSMARFSATRNVLYAVKGAFLKIFDISNAHLPQKKDSITLGQDIETAFSYNDLLFVGGQNSIRIFDISNALQPVKLEIFSHVSSCDPVVFDGTYAYSTLREGNDCGRTVNRLDVIDLKDHDDPKLVKSYPMHEPYGLGIDDSTLFICHGEQGLKIYDATDPFQIHSKKSFSNVHAYDVIPLNGLLILVGDDGLYQYDYSDSNHIEFLSVIPLTR